jgi:hypothetical protein
MTPKRAPKLPTSDNTLVLWDKLHEPLPSHAQWRVGSSEQWDAHQPQVHYTTFGF